MCTGIKVISKENHCFWGRTQEFDVPLQYVLEIIPRDYMLPCQTLCQVKYAVMGVGMREGTMLADGINEKGLSGGSFYFGNDNHYAQTEEIVQNGKKPVRGEEFFTWILTRYSSVEEIKENLNKDIAVSNEKGALGIALPQHAVFHDGTGSSIVVEPSIEGEFRIFDDPIGVITNQPSFDWHLKNLYNYGNLSPKINKIKDLNGTQILSSGKGSGFFGMPGDFTPQSRFIRAVFLSAYAEQVEDEFAPMSAFHILNNFDIPKGVIETVSFGVPQHTQYTSVYDCERKILYYHNYYNRCVQKLELLEEDICKKEITMFEIQEHQEIIDARKHILTK